MIENLKELKDIFDKAKNALQMNKEPVEDLMKLNCCLKAIVDDPKLITETADKDYRKFFFEDMAVGALKRLSLEKSRDEKVRTTLFLMPLKIPFFHQSDPLTLPLHHLVPGCDRLDL